MDNSEMAFTVSNPHLITVNLMTSVRACRRRVIVVVLSGCYDQEE